MKLLKILLSVLLVPVLAIGCASSGGSMEYSYDSVFIEYERLKTRLESTQSLSENSLYQAYAKLFHDIALGNKKEANKFAVLFKKITNNSVDFISDDEVFTFAADYAKIFSNLANGNSDLGIQDIVISNITDHAITLEIPYLDIIRYSISMINEADEWYSNNRLVQYNRELGPYTFQIAFHDTKPSKKFIEKYPPNLIHDIQAALEGNDCKLQLKGVFTPEHGYIIYIGCDKSFEVVQQELITTNYPVGTITIALETN